MFSILNVKYAGRDITACVSKRASQWRRMCGDSKDSERTHIIELNMYEQAAVSKSFLVIHTDETARTTTEGASASDTHSHTSEPLRAEYSHEEPTVACTYIQVQTFNCNRTRLAPTREPRYENSFVQTRHLNYFRHCNICPHCVIKANSIRGEHLDKVSAILVWDWRKLVRSHIVVDGKMVPNLDSWYLKSDAQEELKQSVLGDVSKEELIILSDIAAEEYARQHGNIPYIGNDDRPGFIHSGFRFYRGQKAMYEMLQCAFRELDRVYDTRNIKCVYSKYVDDASYLRYIERHADPGLLTDVCTAFPRMEYETALYLASYFTKYNYDKLVSSAVGIGSLSFDGILSGFRNYYGSVRVYFTNFTACENEYTSVGTHMNKDELTSMNIGRSDMQTVCIMSSLGRRNIDAPGLCAIDITSVDDFHSVGGDFIFNLFSHYMWVGDITAMWLDIEIASVEKLRYTRSAIRHIKDAISESSLNWCRRLLEKETIVIRVSRDARSLTGELCKTCVVIDGDALCFKGSSVVYFSDKDLSGFRSYLTQLRDICTNMSIIGVHVQDVFAYKRELIYTKELEARLLNENEQSLLRHDAKAIWCALNISCDAEARKYGFKSAQAHKDMVCDIKDRLHSFLHIGVAVSSAFYEIITAGNILLKYDIHFKRDHCDDIRKRHLFSIGTLILNTDSFDDRYLNELQYKHAIIIGQGTQSSYDDLFNQDFDSSTFTKRRQRGRLSFSRISEILRNNGRYSKTKNGSS